MSAEIEPSEMGLSSQSRAVHFLNLLQLITTTHTHTRCTLAPVPLGKSNLQHKDNRKSEATVFPPLPLFILSVFVHLLICLLLSLYALVSVLPPPRRQLINCTIIIQAALLNWIGIIPFTRIEMGLPLKPIWVTPSFPASPAIASYICSSVCLLSLFS